MLVNTTSAMLCSNTCRTRCLVCMQWMELLRKHILKLWWQQRQLFSSLLYIDFLNILSTIFNTPTDNSVGSVVSCFNIISHTVRVVKPLLAQSCCLQLWGSFVLRLHSITNLPPSNLIFVRSCIDYLLSRFHLHERNLPCCYFGQNKLCLT